jgi:hypothetical protein
VKPLQQGQTSYNEQWLRLPTEFRENAWAPECDWLDVRHDQKTRRRHPFLRHHLPRDREQWLESRRAALHLQAEQALEILERPMF